jgi:hypothetical protein
MQLTIPLVVGLFVLPSTIMPKECQERANVNGKSSPSCQSQAFLRTEGDNRGKVMLNKQIFKKFQIT